MEVFVPDPLGVLSGLPLPKYTGSSFLIPLPSGADDFARYTSALGAASGSYAAAQAAKVRQAQFVSSLKSLGKIALVSVGVYLVWRAAR